MHKILFYLFIVSIFIIYAGCYALWIPLGDDISYALTLSSVDGAGSGIYPLWKYPWACARHWVFVNGRMANFLAIIFLGLIPQIINSLLTSGIIVFNIFMILKLSDLWMKRGRFTLAYLGIFIFMILFPWWDSMFFLDVAYNYLWTTAFSLSFIYMLHRKQILSIKRKWLRILILIFLFIAGCMHESCTSPVLAALMISLWLNNCKNKQELLKLPKFKRGMIISYAIGTIACIISPGIWMRACSPGTTDDVLWLLLLKSVPLTIIMAVVLLSACVSKAGREWILAQLKSPNGVFVFASILGTAFVCVGGVVGRSGWFSQTFALIAMLKWLSMLKCKIPTWTGGMASLIMATIVVMQGSGVAVKMIDINKEGHELIRLYRESSDGIVYFDSPDCGKLPWWVLGRIRCFKDDDDYTRAMLANYYHKPKIVVLPKELKDIDLSSAKFTDIFNGQPAIALSNGNYISCQLPVNTKEPPQAWYKPDTAIFEADGSRWSAIKFECKGKRYYRLMPHHFDAGDR